MQINIFPNFFRKQLDQKQICAYIFHLLEGAKMCLYNRFFPTLLNISRIFFSKMTTTDFFFFAFLAKIFWVFFFWHFFCAQPFPYFASSDSLEVFFLFITCDNFLHKYLHSMTIKLAVSDSIYTVDIKMEK